MRRLLALLPLLVAAACDDGDRVLRLAARVMPDGGSLRGEGDEQRLVMPVGSVGVFELRAHPKDAPHDPDEVEWLGVPRVAACDPTVLDVRHVETQRPEQPPFDEARHPPTLAGTEAPDDEPHRFAVFAVRPGESCLALDSTRGPLRVRVLVQGR